MIEAQFVSHILSTKSMALVKKYSVGEDHFPTYRTEFGFIKKHYDKYGQVPDVTTFLATFDNFDILEVSENEKYLIETLHEQYLYNTIVPVVHEVAHLMKTDSTKAAEYMRKEVDRISKMRLAYTPGYDIVANAGDWKTEYTLRNSAEGLLGITTGIDELDKMTHGWLPEDLVIILGRTNEGKTWVMLYMLYAAWASGKKVLLYSGEMSRTIVGFRFHTLHGHFKNTALMAGENELGEGDEPKTKEDYEQYIDQLAKVSNPFIVVTPKDIGGRRLDCTVLDDLIELHKPDIVGVDQINIMDDYRMARGDQRRTQLTHISEDLYLLSEKWGVPILSPAQANRDATKTDEEAPEVENIMDSDGIGQNATRVAAIKQVGSTMKIAIRKNRYGAKNGEVLVVWDIDRGIVKPFMRTNGDATEGTPTEDMDGEDLF